MDSLPIYIVIKNYCKKVSSLYFCLFLIFYLRVRDNYPNLLMFHGVTVRCSLPTFGVIAYIHFRPMRDQYTLLWIYNLYCWRTDTVTFIRQENPVALGNPIIWGLSGTSELWFPSTHFYSEAMGGLIVTLVGSAYDLYQSLVFPVCSSFVLDTNVVFSEYSLVILSL